MSFPIKLSTKNFSEASKIVGNDEFCFIFANNNIYCHKFAAAFISKYVSQVL